MKLTRRQVAAASAVVAAMALLVCGATALAGGGQPFAIRWASLRQDGEQLVWRVELAQRFSARGRRSLCLLINRPRTAPLDLCVIGPSHGSRELRLQFDQTQLINATFSRPSAYELNVSFLASEIGLDYRPLRWQVISSVRPAACSSSVSRGGCSALYPGRARLLKLHTPALIGCVPSGRSLVFQGSSDQREIALTFDDGPWKDPPTAQFLDVLEREHVPATFFEIGRQIQGYDPGGAVERQMLVDGDMIGDHTWSHPNMARLSPRAQRTQLLRTAAAIHRATRGFTPCLWRPPGGAISPELVSLARSLGFLTVMWDIDPRDWALPGVGAIYSNVVDHAHNGAIVIQHFGGGPRYQTLAALPHEVDTLRARGYQFVTIDQLLRLRPVYR
jgi:peptidoglycan/xylan/chitin deacetylase (PgdA/CDA1 family)